MKIFDKTLEEYFQLIKAPFVLILFISVAQSLSIILRGFFPFIEEIVISDNFYFFKRNFTNPITILGVFELVIASSFGLYLVAKKGFKLKHNFILGLLFFVSSLPVFFFIPFIFPHIQFLLQLMSYCTLLLLNFLFFILASLFGGILAKMYLGLKEVSYQKRVHSQPYEKDKIDRKPIQRFRY